jgi:predicted permease
MPEDRVETLVQDVRFALRALAKKPAFSAIAVLTLALGIGANTAIFSVINAVLLRTLPVRDPQQLVSLTDPETAAFMMGTQSGQRDLLSYHEFEGLRDHDTAFTSMFATQSRASQAPVSFSSSETGSPTTVLMVSGGYFSTLGVEAIRGNVFGTEVDQGVGAHPVAVVSYEFWQQRMGGDPGVIGRQLRIRQLVFDVVGVAPPDFTGVMVGEAPQIWIPLTMRQAIYPSLDILTWHPGSVTKVMFLQAVGRMKAGMSVAQANASINVTYKQLLTVDANTIADPDQRKGFLNSFLVARDARHGLSVVRGEYEKPLDILMGLVGLLLLLACANVANLLLARATGRNREIAVRVALGASRSRLVKQLLTESVIVALAGGVLGLAFAQWADRVLLHMVSQGPSALPLDTAPDWRVLAFTVAASALTGVLFGLAPAMRATKLDLNNVLRGSGRSIAGTEGGGLPMGKLLVGVQVAISLVLIVVAGLFVRSLQNLISTQFGYNPDGMLMFRLTPGTGGYKGAAALQLFKTLTDRFSAVPGVTGLTISENGLLYGRDSNDNISILGYTPKSGQSMEADWDEIGARYFSVVGIPVLMGRDVTDDDTTGQHACWVNQTMSKYYFGNESPMGREIKDMYPDTPYSCTIVGVVADAKYNGLRGAPGRRFYSPFYNGVEQPGDGTFEIRYSGSGTSVTAAIRQIMHETDSNLDPPDFHTISDLVEKQLLRDRLTARLSAFFGIVALFLASLGLYGVLSYNVSRRTSEIGVRMALGARPSDVLGLIVREALLVTLIGAVIGLAASFAATRVLGTLLYGLTARDPVTFGVATAVLMGVATLAALIPAWRASRVDPMSALRWE